MNNLLLTTSAATVFLGTLYPLFLEAFGGGKVSVGPPFFNATFIPLMVPLVIALGVGPLLPWKRADLGGVLARLKLAFAAALILTLITAYLTWGKGVFGAMGIGIAVWLGASVLVEFGERIGFGRVSLSDSVKRAIGLPRAAWGRTLAHFGLAVTVAGVTGAGLWQVESIQIMRPGDKVEVSGYEFTFEGAENVRGPNYGAERGTFTVRDDGQVVAKLSGERRRYFVSGDETTEAGIHTTAMYDLYAVLGSRMEKAVGPRASTISR